jgi:hypothetical protein
MAQSPNPPPRWLRELDIFIGAGLGLLALIVGLLLAVSLFL